MCRQQLGKLPKKVDALTAEGAAVLAISGDTTEAAARLSQELGLPFPILSDPRAAVVRAFAMYGESMGMPEMGYVVIDRQGRIRARRMDRRFGENVDTIVREVRAAQEQA
ncbi:MAG TPA: redoxin domain-containing protein [Dehalococcoidia bacterium]|nr:redoxin domain-containing protein [Dehalococcoidia bacterium]